jgi:hypothetical protein
MSQFAAKERLVRYLDTHCPGVVKTSVMTPSDYMEQSGQYYNNFAHTPPPIGFATPPSSRTSPHRHGAPHAAYLHSPHMMCDDDLQQSGSRARRPVARTTQNTAPVFGQLRLNDDHG